MAPRKLRYHQENGDVSYVLSSDSLGNSSTNTEEESFLGAAQCALEGYSTTSKPILDETVIQLPHLNLLKDVAASESVAENLLNDNDTKAFFTSGKTMKLQYKKQILQLLDANRCTNCYEHIRWMLSDAKDERKSVMDFMRQSFLDEIQQSTADSFLMMPYFLSNENNKLKLKPFSSLPRRMKLGKDSWIVALGIVGKLLAAKQSTTGKKQFGLRTVFYIPESLGRQSILSDDKQTNSLLSQLKGVAKILEQRIPEKIMEDLNKSETKRLSAIPVCSFVRDSFAAELFSDDETIKCDGSSIKKQRFFIYKKVAESIPEMKKHVGTSLVSVGGVDECLLVGLTKFTGCFQDKQSLSEMEIAVDGAVEKALNGEFRPNSAQSEFRKTREPRSRSTLARVKFFFNARYLWRQGEISAHGETQESARKTFGIRTDVDPIPEWIQTAVVKKLESCKVVEPGFVNAVALNVYFNGKLGLGQHFDSLERFKPPIVSLRLHSDCRLTFGSGYGYVNNLFSVPLLVGEVLSMEDNCYAVKDVTHCIRDYDLLGKSSSMILRHVPEAIISRARLISDWNFVDNVGDEPVALLGSLCGYKERSWFWGQRVDTNVDSKPSSLGNLRKRTFAEIDHKETKVHSKEILLQVSRKPIEFCISGRKMKQIKEPDWSSCFRIRCNLTETGNVEVVNNKGSDIDLVQWRRKEFFENYVLKSLKKNATGFESDEDEFDILDLLGKRITISEPETENLFMQGYLKQCRYSAANFSLESPSRTPLPSDWVFQDYCSKKTLSMSFKKNYANICGKQKQFSYCAEEKKLDNCRINFRSNGLVNVDLNDDYNPAND